MTPVPLVAIVDDDEAVRHSLASLVRSLGYRSAEFGSAIRFLEAASEAQPDLLISDLQMPEMGGLDLQAELARRGRKIPIVFMTGFPSDQTHLRAIANGALAYFTKPANGDDIASCLAGLLGSSCSAK
jgi:FixJ family two-component response regulator